MLVKTFLEIIWMGMYLPINHPNIPCCESDSTSLTFRKQCWAFGGLFHKRQMRAAAAELCYRAAAQPIMLTSSPLHWFWGDRLLLHDSRNNCNPPEAPTQKDLKHAKTHFHTSYRQVLKLTSPPQGPPYCQNKKQSPFSKLFSSVILPHITTYIHKQLN